MPITCIANNGADGSIEVPFYDCPCAVCTKMEWDIREEESTTLREHRHTQFPEYWDVNGKCIARTAIITTDDVERVAAFLPRNYSVVSHVDGIVTIQGSDNAGWTLDGYVLPRLASGLLFGIEVV
jgi:hypothetical protein